MIPSIVRVSLCGVLFGAAGGCSTSTRVECRNDASFPIRVDIHAPYYQYRLAPNEFAQYTFVIAPHSTWSSERAGAEESSHDHEYLSCWMGLAFSRASDTGASTAIIEGLYSSRPFYRVRFSEGEAGVAAEVRDWDWNVVEPSR